MGAQSWLFGSAPLSVTVEMNLRYSVCAIFGVRSRENKIGRIGASRSNIPSDHFIAARHVAPHVPAFARTSPPLHSSQTCGVH